MPYEARLDVENRIAFVTFSGIISRVEIEVYIRSLNADRSFDRSFAQMVEVDRDASADLKIDDMLRLKDLDAFAPESMRVIVAPGGFLFGMARMYQMVADRQNFHVVKTRAEGMKLLGVKG
jgi:hypothetical protein